MKEFFKILFSKVKGVRKYMLLFVMGNQGNLIEIYLATSSEEVIMPLPKDAEYLLRSQTKHSAGKYVPQYVLYRISQETAVMKPVKITKKRVIKIKTIKPVKIVTIVAKETLGEMWDEIERKLANHLPAKRFVKGYILKKEFNVVLTCE